MGKIRKAFHSAVERTSPSDRSEHSSTKDIAMLRSSQTNDTYNEEWIHRYPEPTNLDAFTTEVMAASEFGSGDSHSEASNKMHDRHEVTVV